MRITVTTTSQTLEELIDAAALPKPTISGKPEARNLKVQNISANDIYLEVGGAAATTSSHVLFSGNEDDFGRILPDELHLVSSAASEVNVIFA